MTRLLHLIAIMLTAISMAAGWAHLLALPNKIGLSRADYLVVQQIYSGWALLGIAVVGALVSTALLTIRLRGLRGPFAYALTALVCIALSLAVFFSFTYPANQATDNWRTLPVGWEALRRRWEYSHAVGALLYFVALASLVLAALDGRGRNAPRP